MFKAVSAVQRGRRSEAQPSEAMIAPATLVGRARVMRRDSTEAEDKLWQYLRANRLNGWKFRQQHPQAPYIVDFVCIRAKLIVEVDGSQHSDAGPYDARRTRTFERRGYRVLRFWNNEVLLHIGAVIDAIAAALPLPTAAQSPSPHSGEGQSSPLCGEDGAQRQARKE